ncbi:MAG: TerB family tellurite resistance protein [Alphaproteobacteria bacterium]
MSNPPTKRILGKIVGSLLGLVIGGPWGFLVGFVIGFLYDRQKEMVAKAWELGDKEGFSPETEQSTFMMGVIILSAKMARSDGRVTSAEIEAFKRAFHIAPAEEEAVGEIFNRARVSTSGFEPYAFQLARVFRRKSAVLEQILGGLFIIGSANHDTLSPAEIIFLKQVSAIFGFSIEDFVRIAARSGVELPESEKPRPGAESYAILGIVETATLAETKVAYHALILKHHPDKLIAQGMPPEFVASATEKMKRINVAYETVCKIKGTK